MKFNYLGIDPDPPRRVTLVLLLNSGAVTLGNCNYPGVVAWATAPDRSLMKERCQEILRGLPELRMVRCIADDPVLADELDTALRHYSEDGLADFTDLIRTLDIKAHNGVACIPHNHN
jgi:hypothetical protein